MKIVQQDDQFKPVAIILETEHEFTLMWDILASEERTPFNKETRELAIKIQNTFAHEVSLRSPSSTTT